MIDPLHEPRGPSYWKLNISILPLDQVKGDIRNLVINSALHEKHGEAFLEGWEQLKVSMKAVLATYSRQRARRLRAQNEKLEKFLTQVKGKLQEKPNDEGLL